MARGAFITLLLITLACARVAPRLIEHPHASPPGPPPPNFVHVNADTVIPPPVDDSEMDLNGNDISPAVASYQLDPSGSLYEEHSPQTQLPKLRRPKS